GDWHPETVGSRQSDRRYRGARAQSQSSRSCAETAKDSGTKFSGTAKRLSFSLCRKPTREKLARSCLKRLDEGGKAAISRTAFLSGSVAIRKARPYAAHAASPRGRQTAAQSQPDNRQP